MGPLSLGVQINRSIEQGGADSVNPLSSMTAELVGEIACVVVRKHGIDGRL